MTLSFSAQIDFLDGHQSEWQDQRAYMEHLLQKTV